MKDQTLRVEAIGWQRGNRSKGSIVKGINEGLPTAIYRSGHGHRQKQRIPGDLNR